MGQKMALLVQKFGGTSLASIEHINNAADIVAKAKFSGNDVVVIVSAMSGETDKLIRLSQAISESPDEREYAAFSFHRRASVHVVNGNGVA